MATLNDPGPIIAAADSPLDQLHTYQPTNINLLAMIIDFA